MRRVLTTFLFFVFIIFSSRVALCQAALNAPPEDSVYRAIDTLIAHNLVKDVIIGQRPFSRLEVARILKAARKSLDELKGKDEERDLKSYSKHLSRVHYLDSLISYYEKQYSRELGGMGGGVEFDALSRLEFTTIYNSSKPRLIPVNNGQGAIDGLITSFDRYDQGITYVDGGNSFLSTQHDLYLTPYLAITAQPRFEFFSPQDGDTGVYAHIHKLYAKTGWRNFEVEIGRDNLLWGQGEYGGLMLSANARPLDMLKISNPYPWRAPWIFKYLGHMKFTFFVSNLGPEYNYPYAYFFGAKFTLRPSRHIEFGLSETIFMAGDGAPKLSFWDPLLEFLPFHKAGKNIYYQDKSNHAFGFLDFRVTIPPLRSSILYYDGYFEDSMLRVLDNIDNILNQMSFIVGCYVPRLTYDGDWSMRLEYHHIAPLTYRHSSWVSGYTLNRRLMGDPLGPDADGVYATLYWRPKPAYLMRLDLAYEDYDSSTYYTETNAQGGGERILKLTAGPHERRYRAMLGVEWLGNKRYGLEFSAGYERIENWNFQVGRSVNNMFLEGVLTLRFGEFNLKSS